MAEIHASVQARAEGKLLTKPVLEVADLAVSFDNASNPGAPRIQAVAGVVKTHRQVRHFKHGLGQYFSIGTCLN